MTESFALLFEESLNELETRPGAIVKGTVVAIENGYVLVDAGLSLSLLSLLMNSRTLLAKSKSKSAQKLTLL